MQKRNTILIVDDDAMAKKSLIDVFKEEYDILHASNGKEALKVLEKNTEEIVAIILDLIMPKMDGISFLEKFNEKPEFRNIPVIVATSNEDEGMEQKCLELGVWDFVMKPYNPVLLRFRIKNVIDKSQMIMAERDSVTRLYTKMKFYQAVRQILMRKKDTTFAFVRIDIDRFKMINNFYGIKEGDKVLISIAQELKRISDTFDDFVYGRLDNDVFACCLPYREENIEVVVKALQIRVKQGKKDYNIKLSCGVYVIEDCTMDISEMYDRAFLAAKNCKGQFMENIAYYDDSMIENMRHEQFVINDVNKALEEEQFVVYLQPKINLATDRPYGAEALVRWKHPEKGMISPADFIPVYERNGIIGKLDQYMWTQACKLLRKWLDEGKDPDPISVNVSRVNLYNPRLVEILNKIITQYKIPAHLLNLELTESAFMEDQELIMRTMSKLHKLGFKIMMDDFGSGFSSLNILKDMELDYLKVDMKFLDTQDFNGRGEKVLTSVVRMAKWLQLPAIVEGVETEEQVDFLKCIGCEYAQGFYFAAPMSVLEYEKYMMNAKSKEDTEFLTPNISIIKELWNSNSNASQIFDSIGMPMVLYEYKTNKMELLRTNTAYDQEFFSNDLDESEERRKQRQKEKDYLFKAFKQVITSKKPVTMDYKKQDKWYRIYINNMGNKKDTHVILVTFVDISEYKK